MRSTVSSSERATARNGDRFYVLRKGKVLVTDILEYWMDAISIAEFVFLILVVEHSRHPELVA